MSPLLPSTDISHKGCALENIIQNIDDLAGTWKRVVESYETQIRHLKGVIKDFEDAYTKLEEDCDFLGQEVYHLRDKVLTLEADIERIYANEPGY